MKLPLPGFSKKQSPSVGDHTFALWISTTHVQAAIWQPDPQSQAAPSLVASSSLLPINWNDAQERLKVIDTVLSQAAQLVGIKPSDPTQVLLGLPGTWVSQGQLQPSYRQLLKQITEGLELKPMGFVVTSEAMLHGANQSLGVTNGLILGMGKQWLEVGLAVQGQMSQLLCFEYSQTLTIQEIMAGISQLSGGHLPPRILIWGEDDHFLSSMYQVLQSHNWQEAPLGFMHLPSVERIPAGALQTIVYSVTAHYEHVPPMPTEQTQQVMSHDSNENIIEDDHYQESSTVETEEIDTESEAKAEVDQSITSHTANTTEILDKPQSVIPEPTEQPLLTYGFVRDGDIRQVSTAAKQALSLPVVPGTITPRDIPDFTEDQEEIVQDSMPRQTIKKESVEVLQATEETEDIYEDVPSSKKRLWRWLIGLLVMLLLIVGLGVGGVWAMQHYAKAEVNLRITTQALEQTFPVTIDPNLQSEDLSAGVFKGELLTVSVDGSETIDASGKDRVGEKATGEITIFNDTDTSRTLPLGTKLVTADKKFTFITDTSVQIASKSVDLSSDSPFTPGKSVAKVTAEQIGAEYNLAAQTAFNVANFSGSVLIARNDKAFSGGTSQEVTVVTKQDRQKALDALTKSLRQNALTSANNSASGITVIPDSGTFEWKEQTFSKKVGEQASAVTAQGTLEYTLVGYDPSVFDSYAKMKLKAAIPDQKTLKDTISTQFTQKEASDSGIYTFEVVASGTLKPTIPEDKIKQRLQGSSVNQVSGYLQSLPGVESSSFTITPQLPAMLERFPSDPDRISIVIEE